MILMNSPRVDCLLLGDSAFSHFTPNFLSIFPRVGEDQCFKFQYLETDSPYIEVVKVSRFLKLMLLEGIIGIPIRVAGIYNNVVLTFWRFS